MKLSRTVLAALALNLMISLPIYSQEAPGNREADHEALRALKTKVAEAIGKQDLDALATFFAKEFAFTTSDQTLITSKAELKTYYDKVFREKDSVVTSIASVPEADVLTRFVSENVGYCYGTTKDTYTLRRGGKITLDARWTATVVKEDGEWKIAAVHTGVNFLDNAVNPRNLSFWQKLKRLFSGS